MWAEPLTRMILEDFASHAPASRQAFAACLHRAGAAVSDGRCLTRRTPSDIREQVSEALPEQAVWTIAQMLERLDLNVDLGNRRLIGGIMRRLDCRVTKSNNERRYHVRAA